MTTLTQRHRTRFTFFSLLLALSLVALIPLWGRANAHAPDKNKKSNLVYVCACLKNKSCYCMTEAKTEGPCSCGTQGGPPLKPVPYDSDWAKENREALAQP